MHGSSSSARDISDAELEPYLRPWLGPVGQAAYYRQVAQFDERYAREIEPRYREIQTPTLVLWGEQDGCLSPGDLSLAGGGCALWGGGPWALR
jgi:pimeloyl-ACP methyl ester carboxylesterase